MKRTLKSIIDTIKDFLWSPKRKYIKIHNINQQLQRVISSKSDYFRVNPNNQRFCQFTIDGQNWEMGYHLLDKTNAEFRLWNYGQNNLAYHSQVWSMSEILDKSFVDTILEILQTKQEKRDEIIDKLLM